MNGLDEHDLRNESGSAMVEFALYMSIFVLMLMGIVNYSFLIEEKMQLQEAAAAGAAFGTIPGNYNNFTGMEAAAKAAVSTKLAATMQAPIAVNVYSCSPGGAVVARISTCSDGGTPLMFVQVSTSATEPMVLKYFGMTGSLSMTGFASYEVPWI